MSGNLLLLFTADIHSLDSDMQKKVYMDFYHLVFAKVLFIVKDRTVVDDIIQESFLRVIQHPPKTIDEKGLKAWLMTVTRNVTFNYLRKHKKWRNELIDESVFVNEIEAISVSQFAVDKEVELKMMKEAVIEYLQQLKPEYCLLIQMKVFDHLTYKEIAEELNVTEGVVRQKLYRAREAIKKQLRKDWVLDE